MASIPLKAQDREILGKKVKYLRRQGLVPAHVYGNTKDTEHVSVNLVDFVKVYDQAGETGLIDLRIGDEKTRPVLIRGVQVHPVTNHPLHIDFYQVNLKEKITVSVPVSIIGDEPELVHIGEAVVIQPLTEVEVEALPTDLPEGFEVDITLLKQIGEAILVSQLTVPQGVTVLTDKEAVLVKLDTAITEEMQKLLEEQASEAAAVAAAAAEAEVVTEGVEGEEVKEGEATETEGQEPVESTEEKIEEAEPSEK